MINARIKNKRDTESNWSSTNPTLLNGEIIVVDSSDGTIKMKIGDGVSTYSQLPFIVDEMLEEQVAELESTISECFLKTGGTISGDVSVSGTTTTGGVFSKVTNLTNSIIDVSTASCFTRTITGTTAFIFTGVPSEMAACFSIIVTNGGNHTVFWQSDTVMWAAGSPPDLTKNGTDVLTFITMDGGNTWYGCPSILAAATNS